MGLFWRSHSGHDCGEVGFFARGAFRGLFRLLHEDLPDHEVRCRPNLRVGERRKLQNEVKISLKINRVNNVSFYPAFPVRGLILNTLMRMPDWEEKIAWPIEVEDCRVACVASV